MSRNGEGQTGIHRNPFTTAEPVAHFGWTMPNELYSPDNRPIELIRRQNVSPNEVGAWQSFLES